LIVYLTSWNYVKAIDILLN